MLPVARCITIHNQHNLPWDLEHWRSTLLDNAEDIRQLSLGRVRGMGKKNKLKDPFLKFLRYCLFLLPLVDTMKMP